MPDAPTDPFSTAAAVEILSPLTRCVALAIYRALEKRPHCGALNLAYAVEHALSEYMRHSGKPSFASDADAERAALETLFGRRWLTYQRLRREGRAPHEALHEALTPEGAQS